MEDALVPIDAREAAGMAVLGCLAMMTSIFESIAYNARGTDDILNIIVEITDIVQNVKSDLEAVIASSVDNQ